MKNTETIQSGTTLPHSTHNVAKKIEKIMLSPPQSIGIAPVPENSEKKDDEDFIKIQLIMQI